MYWFGNLIEHELNKVFLQSLSQLFKVFFKVDNSEVTGKCKRAEKKNFVQCVKVSAAPIPKNVTQG